MKVIDLLNKIANREEVPEEINYKGIIYSYNEGIDYKNNYGNFLMGSRVCICPEDLNDEVEIIEDIKQQNLMPEIENFRAFKKFIEENKKELHANNIEFNINNDKRDCIITLDENDLGIDKLHLDNCYFYKENDKWYVKHINLKPIAYISQEHKIPEKLTIGVNEYDEIHINNEIYGERQVRVVADKINEIIDYLEKIK